MSRSTPKINSSEQFQLAIDLLDWMQQGINTWQALQLIQTSAAELQQHRLKNCASFILDELSSGKSLGQCFAGWAINDIVVILDSGLEARQMRKAMQERLQNYQKMRGLLATIMRQLSYPMVLLLTSLVAVTFIGAQIIPRLVQSEQLTSLPLISRTLVQFATFTLDWGWSAVLIFVALLTFGYLIIYKNMWLLLKSLTVFNAVQIYKLICAVSVLNQLSLMAQYAQNLATSCVILRQHAKGLAHYHYAFMLKQYGAGMTDLAEIMNSGLLDSSALMRLRMSSGHQRKRSEQISQLAVNLLERANAMIVQRLRVSVWTLYGLSAVLVSWSATGAAQAVMQMLEDWSY
ncbi:MAG: type 2a secretion system assembly platform component PulF [Idiomarinaceae bacterium HL-53]|nr:MAG: type 2a secretion system assembly platform component PulF [Idiomarinaceae bacterium HL-53]CUS49390.1 Type II secretion system (T2SS), protein F [Idiomarinaceae bacterium HL-53]